ANDAGKTITVRATYTDNAQHSEAPTSSATTPVVDPANPNPQPPQPQPNHEGDVAISGNAKVGETLTAQVHDADQFDEAKVSYQWQRDGQDIAGANGKTYTLTAEDEGHKISVKAEYTDNAGNKESHDAESGVVQPQSSTNQAPTDISLDNDKVAEGKDGAAIGKLTTTDPDAGDKHTYKVSDDRFEVTNDGTLKLKDGKHLDYANEKTVTLQVTTDDGHGGSYNKTFTLNVEDDPNYPPVNPPGGNHEGTVTISGNAKVGETLTAEVQDQDGVPDTGVTYQWLRDGKEIAGATGKSYTLTADDVGQKISVKAAYQDNAQHAEAPTSAETEAVTQIDNNQPGSVTIVHPQDIETGAVLRAVIDDSDGVPTAGVLYQWLRDGKPINHANPVARYELRSEDEGHDISVHVEYTDKNGHKESLTSEPLNFPEDKGPDFTLERGTGTEQGGVTLIPTEKATIADLNYEKNGLSQNVHIVRADANSPWHSDDPLPQGVTLDAKTGVLKVAPQEVDDGSQVYASVYEGRSSKTLYLITENDVGNPPLPQSEAEVSFYTTDSIIEGNAQSYVVRLSKPAETDVTVELKISHVSTNESQIHAETRTITIPKGQISKTVFVETEDDKQFSADARFQAELQNPQGAKLADQDTSAITRIIDNDGPQAPVLKAGSEVGGVEILPQEGAKILHVYYQSEADGSTQDFVATRNNDGRWTAREPHDRVTLDAQTGKVTLGALAVQDRSEVRAFNESELHVRSEESKIFAGDNPASPPPAVNQQGTVTISGDTKVGSTLTAEVTDGDGVPSDGVKYQWLRDNTPISGATGKSYVLTTDDAGHKITVKAEYDDNAKHHETPVSQPTENIADNAPPAVNQQGTVTISGDPKVGSTLTAEVTDGDGVPSDGVKYQWLRDGNPIASATGKSYVLTAEDAGHKITVKAEYDDNAQNHETPVSQPTENIADNSAPPPAANHPGSVTLEGEAKIGHTLTAKLTDADGVPDSGITWRWYGDDKLLPGVEGQTITLTDAVKGMQLRAEAVYTDKAGHAEKPISDLSPAVVPEAANNSDLFPPPAANAPHITLSGVTSVKEGEKATYTVSLDKPASEDVSVDVHVKHNSTDTSDANLTYKIQRVVIPKGETSKNFTVDTHNDGKAEGTETYTVEIGNALVGNVNDNVPPFSGSVSAQSMIIPAYKYPTGAWEKDTYWDSVHKAGGGKVPYVIVNPASGVGEKVKSDYAKLIDDNITAGIKNIGYIRTHYQTRPIEEVKAEVDKYLELYGKDKIHGYFFDEITAQNNQGTAYMAELYRYVKAKAGDKLVMANPGTHITDAIAPYADIFVTSEVSAKTYLNNYEQPKSAFENDPKNAHRIMHMIHDVTPDQYDAVIKASRERNAGWVFPTSDTQENPLPEAEREKHPEQDGNPYNALPQNFDQLAANVNNLGMPTNPTQHDNNGKLATANIDNNHVTTEIVDANNAAPLEHHEPQLQPADGAVASAADGLEAAAADHTRGGDGHDVLIGDGIDAAAYSQLVSHQGEDLLQYLGQHSAELLAASQQSASHELHGGAGDDVLIAGHGAQLLEGGTGADTFAYLLDSNDAASWNEPSRILDFNPQEGDRIVLAGGAHLKAEVS
ncbi:spherulation-specific family 4 protein, partial [Cardiobacterium hominis]